MLISLSSKNKVGFVDGTIAAPESDSSKLKSWSRCNDIVISWILNSLTKEIAKSVLYSKTAREIQINLEDRFGQCNGAQLYHLQKELSELTHGSNDIAIYFTKMKNYGKSWML